MVDIEKIKQAIEAGKPRLVYDNSIHKIIETKPAFRTVKILERKATERIIKTYRLAVPYIQYYVSYGGYRKSVTWTDKPLETLEQVVSIPLLPNVYSNFLACVSLSFPHLEVVENFCHSFWNSVFTPDEDRWHYRGVIEDTKLQSFQHWHELSKEANDPMEVFEGFDFRSASTIAKKIIRDL
jgi:hypothetical protein